MLDLKYTFISSDQRHHQPLEYYLPKKSVKEILDWWATASVKEKTEFYRELEKKGEALYVHDNLFHVYLDYDE